MVTLTVKDGNLSYQRGSDGSFPLQMMRDNRLHFTPNDLSCFSPIRDAEGRVYGLDFIARGGGQEKLVHSRLSYLVSMG
ncbi:hypothetical protein [Sphingobium sp. YR768]|uniref:hypothetical protein n=1 Tax=Sphingobium sp. YR768 TaxID=1884365 RepID=UPI00115FDE32|nr:hypothetical protein [Sphingobium sp. YR768]